MKHHFRLLLSLTAILALGSLAACSGKPTTPPSAHNRVTLTFWHGMTGASQQTLNGLVRGFNHSQSKYTVVASGQGDFANVQQKIMAAAKSDTLPTIAQTTYTNVPDYVHGQFIVPLNTYLPKHTMARIDPNLRQVSYYRGQTYAMPFSKSIGLLFYNRDLLKQTHTAVPKSWEALQRDATRVKAQGLTGLALNQNFAAEWDTLAFQAGTPLMTPRPKLTSPKMLAATHVVYDMLKAKTATTAGTDGYGNVQFFKGKTLFYSGSSAAIGVLQTSTPKGFHWGTAPLPSYRGNRHVCALQGNDLVMFKSASPAQRRGVAAFMTYLLGQKQTLKWAKATGYLPLTTQALKSRDYRRYLAKHPAAKATVQSLPHTSPDPTFYGYTAYRNAVNQTADQLSALSTTPEKGLKQLQQQRAKQLRAQ